MYASSKKRLHTMEINGALSLVFRQQLSVLVPSCKPHRDIFLYGAVAAAFHVLCLIGYGQTRRHPKRGGEIYR